MEKLLEGKVAIITGSGRGIGKSIAMLFVKEGAKVVINDIDPGPLDETVAEIKAMGGECIGVVADVTNEEQVQAMVQKCVEAFGGVDILVNNAGFTRDAMVHKMDDQMLRLIIDINLKGTFLCTKAVLPYLKDEKKKDQFKKIVNFASTTGVSGNVGQTNYAMAKGGIIAFTKACARELCLERINVNCVAPGFTATRMTAVKEKGAPRDSLGIPKAIRDLAIQAIPFGRAGEPEDIAKVVLFFCSPLANWVTGQLLTVDGGQFI
ncbi:MAG: 3-oxoacyl-[acyl-carrier-protein] reductase [Promethearchaeota archaeon]